MNRQMYHEKVLVKGVGYRIEGVGYRIEKDTVGLKVECKPCVDEVAVPFGVVLIQFCRTVGYAGLF